MGEAQLISEEGVSRARKRPKESCMLNIAKGRKDEPVQRRKQQPGEKGERGPAVSGMGSGNSEGIEPRTPLDATANRDVRQVKIDYYEKFF